MSVYHKPLLHVWVVDGRDGGGEGGLVAGGAFQTPVTAGAFPITIAVAPATQPATHPPTAQHRPHRCDLKGWLVRLTYGPCGSISRPLPYLLICPKSLQLEDADIE